MTCNNNFTLQTKFAHRRRLSQKWPKVAKWHHLQDPFFYSLHFYSQSSPTHCFSFFFNWKVKFMPNCFVAFFFSKKTTLKKALTLGAYSILSFNPRKLFFYSYCKSPANSAFGAENFAFLLEWDWRYCHLKLTTFRRNDLNFVRPLYPLSLWTAPIYTLEGRTHSIVANLQYDLCQL